MPISEDDLRGLSANEREALLADDDADGDIARELGHAPRAAAPAAAPAAPGSETETDEEEDAAAAAAALAAAPAPAASPAAAPATGDPATEEEGDEDDAPAPPERATPDDVAEQRKSLRAEKAEAMKQLLDGEIDQAAYQAIEDKVQDALDVLVRAEASDQAREGIARDAMMRDYTADLKATVKLGKASGLDYTDPKLGPRFDRALKMFSTELSEQGVFDTPGNLANSRQALAEAHAYMLRGAGKPAPAPAAGAPAAPAPAPAGPRNAPDRSKLGVTLAGVPTAADARITSEFAHLEGISEPAALERELAKMTPEQQERYLGE